MNTPHRTQRPNAPDSGTHPRTQRPTAETDPGDCRWCFIEALGVGEPCPYHGEQAQQRALVVASLLRRA